MGTKNTISHLTKKKKKGRERTDPLVVGLMKVFIQEGDVEPSMYPIDTVVREQQISSNSISGV